MIRKLFIVLVALFALGFAIPSQADGDGEGDTVVWGT